MNRQSPIRTVHLVFKTHLDIGFTDFARHVVRRYFEQFIPRALALARELREKGEPERFVWTTGSWLIYEYLEQAGARGRREMEAGIAAGGIAWHGLPFTTHTELMDASLFRFGLSLSRSLDARFGRRTIAAKMTDVPGHTRSIVPLMAEAGIRFLHIGVNPACPPPAVPPLFRWRAPGGEELLVGYSGAYGAPMTAAGLRDGLAFAHTGDNCGPPPAEGILRSFDDARRAFPGARVVASTLDAFAEKLAAVAARLPVVEHEIGDTWIHGAGTDPRKIAGFRALCRLRAAWEADGTARRFAKGVRDFSRRLLLVPEHTWGLDVKTHLGDYRNYSARDFARARRRDAVPASAVPPRFSRFGDFRRHAAAGGWKAPQSYRKLEASWAEQRNYLAEAVAALRNPRLARQAEAALAETVPALPRVPGRLRPADPGQEFEFARLAVRFDRECGAIAGLRGRSGRKLWCDPRHPMALYRYETFSQAAYDRWLSEYAVNMDQDWCWPWAIPDLSKPGMGLARPQPRHAARFPLLQGLYRGGDASADQVLAILAMPGEACDVYGAPRQVFLRYCFLRDAPAVEIELLWFGKSAARLPEASWFSFIPRVASPGGWTMEKMGAPVSPLDVVEKGNRTLHAVGDAVRYEGPDGRLTIRTLDAPLVAPGAPRLLRFTGAQPDLNGGMHFNLQNNVWGTNFPMWCEDDARFRFRLEVES